MRDLHLTTPIMTGSDVLRVQRRLKTLKCSPGVLDGKYGVTTEHAVRRFQKAHKLKVDGVVGAQTRRALNLPKAKPVVISTGKSKGVLALTEAIKHIGVKESPMNSNKQKFGVWFGVNGVPWCNILVSYCFVKGAGVVLGADSRAAGYYRGKGFAYVPSCEAWLRNSGKWVGKTTPHPGDIAIFNWDKGAPDHIGIVEKYLGGGKFMCIEGNTAIGNDSNGGEVMRRERYISQVNGFGRL